MRVLKAKNERKRVGSLSFADFKYVASFLGVQAKALLRTINKAKKFNDFVLVAKQAFYLQRYIDDMTHFGWPEITRGIERSFKEDRAITRKDIFPWLQNEATRHFLKLCSGQHVLGENPYIIYNGLVYYRTLRGVWHEIAPKNIFLLLPPLAKKANDAVSKRLDSIYTPGVQDKLYNKWAKGNYNKSILSNQILIKNGVTTPDKYSTLVLKQIRALLASLPSISAIKKLGCDDMDIESLFKISFKLFRFVQKFRSGKIFPLYILRDGMMFAEVHAILNFLENNKYAYDAVMIGRKLLSTPREPERYWRLVVDVLYHALRKHSKNFDDFNKEYIKRMRRQEKLYPELAALFKKLSKYIAKHINSGRQQIINVVDTGLQGSVNMLIKYLIDNYLKLSKKSDIKMFVVGEWFKKVYENKFASDYYPMMKDIEVLSRSEYVYKYKQGSFERGKLEVVMGNRRKQILANAELMVLVVVVSLLTNNKLM